MDQITNVKAVAGIEELCSSIFSTYKWSVFIILRYNEEIQTYSLNWLSGAIGTTVKDTGHKHHIK